MPSATSVTEPGTRDRILDSAQRLIQLRGYSAISYADIARELGIRKASIHYYFPAKADLGDAVIARYAAMFEGSLTDVAGRSGLSRRDVVEAYFVPYMEFAATPDMVCLCGALAGELPALPDAMQARLGRFFSFHQNWLTQVLTVGQDAGEFGLPVPPGKYAQMIVNLLQGALLIKRATGNSDQLNDAIAVVRSQLAPVEAGA